jgi:hypothetical protein
MMTNLKKWRYSAIACSLFLVPSHSSAQAGYQAITVDNPGTIDGMVMWSGAVPTISKLPVSKDPKICDPDSIKTRDLERLMISSDHGVANAVVSLKNITRGKAMDLPEVRRTLDQRACRYVPHILLVPVDANVQVMSSDPVLHTLQMFGAASYNLPFPFQNQFVSRTMHQAGGVEMKCNAGHVWMNAEMLVVKHPYYTVTDYKGEYHLTGVPPGDYELELWHEGWKIVREETVLDVAAQVEVHRPIYSEPKTWTKKVKVAGGQSTRVNFTISEE